MFIKFIHNDASAPRELGDLATDSPSYDVVEIDAFERMKTDKDGVVFLKLSKYGHEFGYPRQVLGTAYVMNNDGKTIDRIDA